MQPSKEMLHAPIAIGNTICLAVRDSLALALGRLVVGLDVEVDEETQVAGEQQAAEDGGGLRSSAVAEMGKVLVVGRSIVVVGYTWGQHHG